MQKMVMALMAPLAAIMLGGAVQELSNADATGILNRTVRDSSGQDVGTVVDVIVDPAGHARAIVIDTGGFMGVGARRVAVAWPFVHVPPPNTTEQPIAIDLSDDQVKSAPEYTDRSKPAIILGLPTDPATKP